MEVEGPAANLEVALVAVSAQVVEVEGQVVYLAILVCLAAGQVNLIQVHSLCI